MSSLRRLLAHRNQLYVDKGEFWKAIFSFLQGFLLPTSAQSNMHSKNKQTHQKRHETFCPSLPHREGAQAQEPIAQLHFSWSMLVVATDLDVGATPHLEIRGRRLPPPYPNTQSQDHMIIFFSTGTPNSKQNGDQKAAAPLLKPCTRDASQLLICSPSSKLRCFMSFLMGLLVF